jgi:hypothetical protein
LSYKNLRSKLKHSSVVIISTVLTLYTGKRIHILLNKSVVNSKRTHRISVTNLNDILWKQSLLILRTKLNHTRGDGVLFNVQSCGTYSYHCHIQRWINRVIFQYFYRERVQFRSWWVHEHSASLTTDVSVVYSGKAVSKCKMLYSSIIGARVYRIGDDVSV